MREKKKILFVINPIAGVGDQKYIERLIEAELDHGQYEYTTFYTERPKHALELKRLGLLKETDMVAAVGGDGSINEVASNLVGTTLTLAIIPAGSGNGIARHLKIPVNPRKAIRRLNEGKTTIVDTAMINDHFFLNVAGIGFDATVSRQFAEFGQRGLWSYLRVIWQSFFTYTPDTYELIVDGKSLKTTAFLIAIANSSQYGNNAYIAPHASMQDGFLDVAVLLPFSFFRIPGLTFRLFSKSIEKSKFMQKYKGKEISILQKSRWGHYDGEPFRTGTKLEIRIKEKSLHVIV